MSTKRKLTIYIDEEILQEIKIKAIKENISLSALTELLYKSKINKEIENDKKNN